MLHVHEFNGISSAEDISASTCASLRNALASGKVVCMPNAGEWMTPMEQMRIATLLGTVDASVSRIPEYVYSGVHQSAHADAPASGLQSTMIDANRAWQQWHGHAVPKGLVRLVREPGDPKSFGEGFHADQTYLQEPPRYTFLLGRELPGGGDDTVFIDMERAYDTLADDVKAQLCNKIAVHHDSAGRHAYHPVARRIGGAQMLNLNCHFAHEIVGDDPAKTLLRHCLAHIERQPAHRFKWDGRHALLWDNWQVVHSASADWTSWPSAGYRRRELHRVVIQDGRHGSRL